jgi:hypothetical protein
MLLKKKKYQSVANTDKVKTNNKPLEIKNLDSTKSTAEKQQLQKNNTLIFYRNKNITNKRKRDVKYKKKKIIKSKIKKNKSVFLNRTNKKKLEFSFNKKNDFLCDKFKKIQKKYLKLYFFKSKKKKKRLTLRYFKVLPII